MACRTNRKANICFGHSLFLFLSFSPSHTSKLLHLYWANHLSKGVSPAVEEMAAVTPGVAFDLSVNLESRAFIGSILEAEVSSRHDFTLEH